MMMKRFSFRSRGIGAIDLCVNAILFFLMLLLLSVPGTDAFAEEGTENMQSYKYEEFAAYLSFPKGDDPAMVFSHTISVADGRALNVSVHSLLRAFPDFVVEREMPSSAGMKRYVAYKLEDGGRLFVFTDDNKITNICRMEPRCTADEFSAIEKDVSSPYDVVGIDKNTVFNPFIQWGPVSYHCLSDGTFYMVRYKQSSYSPEEFTVDYVAEISKDECLSVLSVISPDDMPTRD